MVNQKYLKSAFVNLNLRDFIPSSDFIKEDTNSKEAISIGDNPFALSEWVGGQQGRDLSPPCFIYYLSRSQGCLFNTPKGYSVL
jgi:hypothetical protein